MVMRSNSSTLPNVTVITNSSEQPTSSLPLSDELLTIAEVAVYLKLSRRTTWRWCKSGQLPAVKVGHQWRVARSDLENFIRQQHRKLK